MFLALAKTENTIRAARELGLDRSTLSRRVTSLEENLGTRLFLRTREGLRLTPAGERLRHHVERMASVAGEIMAAGWMPDDAVAGVVRLATTEGLGSYLVQRGLLQVSQTHPDLLLEIHTGNRPVDLARGEVDLALRPLPPQESQLRVRRLIDMPIALYATEDYVRRHGHPFIETDLRNHCAVLPCGELGRLPEALWLAQVPGMRVAFRSNHFSTLIAAALAGVGIVPLAVSWGDQEPKLLRLFFLSPQVPPRSLWLVINPDAARRAAVWVVAETVSKLLKTNS